MLNRVADLTSCDVEPIHIIGAIQPHGALVAIEHATMEIAYASLNTALYLGREPADLIGRPAAFLLGEANCADLLARSLEPRGPELLRPWFVRLARPDGSTADLECYAHGHAGRIILEFVWRQDGPAMEWEEELLRQTIVSELMTPKSLAETAETGTRIIRQVTGFDRVMIYRFAPDKHGEVIAEDTTRPDRFLGMHYPASDIPDPARRHFVLNVIRTIPDIDAAPVPIVGREGAIADASAAVPLDLTYSKLRAVAPVHIEYLNNMGVAASMSISLIANGELWGLVACHHYAPLHLSWSRLRFCELLGSTISSLLQSQANLVKLDHSIQAEKLAFEIERQARRGKALHDVMRDNAPEILAQSRACGLVLRLDGRFLSIGAAPALVPDLATLGGDLVEGIATSDQLATLGPAESGERRAAGMALLEISEDGQDYLALFRDEFAYTIRWAGKPEKVETRLDDRTVRLSPRGSFAVWSEERRGRSIPFSDSDLEVLRITRRVLSAINSLDRERRAVAAKMAAEAEEARLKLVVLDAARDRSMGELAAALAHELNQPLSAVTNYVNASRKELRNYGLAIPDAVGALMDSAIAESSRASDLVRRLRNFIARGEIAVEPVDLGTILRQGVELALVAAREERPDVVFDLEPGLPPIMADPIQIGQVVLNLVRNSLPALAEARERLLTVSTRRKADRVEISVRDTGHGIPWGAEKLLFEPFHSSTTSGMGIGLSLCRSIVEAHGGKIWLNSDGPGAEIVFSLPIEGNDDGC